MAIIITTIRIKIITIIVLVIVIIRKTEPILTEYSTNQNIDHLSHIIESRTDCTITIIE